MVVKRGRRRKRQRWCLTPHPAVFTLDSESPPTQTSSVLSLQTQFSLPCLPALFMKKNLPAQRGTPLTLDPALSLGAVQGFIFCLGFKTGLDQMR